MLRAGQLLIFFAVVVVAVWGVVVFSSDEPEERKTDPSATSTTAQTAPPEQDRITLADQKNLKPVRETAGVRSGVAVYSDNRGRGAEVRSIPFGKRVTVVCVAPNEAGIASINAFYLLDTPPWSGLFASANQFLNGTKLGETTNEGQLNPAVQKCRERG